MTGTNGTSRWTGVIAVGVGAFSLFGSMIAWTYTLQDRLTRMETALSEIETQFCAQDIVRNLMHANDMRQMSILWEKQFGLPYPIGNAYYPTICNRPVRR